MNGRMCYCLQSALLFIIFLFMITYSYMFQCIVHLNKIQKNLLLFSSCNQKWITINSTKAVPRTKYNTTLKFRSCKNKKCSFLNTLKFLKTFQTFCTPSQFLTQSESCLQALNQSVHTYIGLKYLQKFKCVRVMVNLLQSPILSSM